MNVPIWRSELGGGLFDDECRFLPAAAPEYVRRAQRAGYDDPDESGRLFATSAELFAFVYPLSVFGGDVVRETVLGVGGGDGFKGCHAASEPHGGTDSSAARSTASRTPGGWVLTGKKYLISNLPGAAFALVLARTDDRGGVAGTTSFVVDLGDAGCTVTPTPAPYGSVGAQLGSLGLRDVFVPDDMVLGEVGAGSSILAVTMKMERALILAPFVGIMRRLLHDAVAEAKSSGIARLINIQERLVRMRLAVETSSLLIDQAASAIADGRLSSALAAMVKLHVSNEMAAFAVELQSVRGGRGFVDHGTMRFCADAVASRSFSGSSDAQVRVVASEMGIR